MSSTNIKPASVLQASLALIWGILVQLSILVGSHAQADPRGAINERDLGHFYSLLEIFKESCGRYPLTKEGLKVLKTPPAKLKCKRYPKMLDEIRTTDAFGKLLKYKSNGKAYRLDASHGYFLTEKSPLHGGSHFLTEKLAPPGANHWDNPNPIPETEEDLRNMNNGR